MAFDSFNPALRQLVARLTKSAVIWSFTAVALRLASTILLLPLILRRIPPEHLGLWYIFLALGAVAALVDFGFAPTVSRVTAYAWAGAAELNPLGPPAAVLATGDSQPNYILLSRLIGTLRAYYRYVGLLLITVMGVGGGAWVWHKTASLPEANSLRIAWCVYALGACTTFMNSLWSDLLIGINGVRQSQLLMVVGQIGFYVIAITGLLLGAGIWALVLGNVVSAVTTRLLFRAAFVRLAHWTDKLPKPQIDRSIVAAMWPTAWRTGLVTIAGYSIVQANTIICSAFLDLKTTASYGLSVQLITTLVGVSSVWLQVKFPLINQLRAQGRLDAIVPLFINRMHLAIVTFAAGAVLSVWLLPTLLRMMAARTEVLPRDMLIVFFIVQFLEMHHSLYGGLVYTEHRNPFLLPAAISGVLIVSTSILLTPRIGVWGLILSAGLVQLCFNNWWAVLRAIRGLGDAGIGYWRRFFDMRTALARIKTTAALA